MKNLRKNTDAQHLLDAHIPWYRTRKFWMGVVVIQICLSLVSIIILGFKPVIILGVLGSTIPSLLLADNFNLIISSLSGTAIVWIAVFLLIRFRVHTYIFCALMLGYYLLNLYATYSLSLY